ncbi:protein hypothetical protein [Limosa lapponica baueri]|uniref:Dynein axonemal intermediate chain 7 n=1 Tax=Limosa lapponica baueri TaxID=1758121 RepID=A0A2I0TWL8_LIMLA|nr:protein hypothetical protein [Limosa lapponica baueri]
MAILRRCAGKSGGKKKVSKAEQLRLQKEEEERRLKEEEEAQLQAQQEEAARLEKERIEQEQMENLKAKWERYLSCDGSPDPTVLQEINTFMSLWREDQNEDVQLVMEKGEQVLNTANMYEDSESGNMQAVIKDKNVTFCIWANLKKKVRFKNHMFCDVEHGFDLPKSLAVSSVAIRILHTHYDHVSPLWLQCQSVPKLEVLDSEELTQHSKDNVEEPEEEEKKSREEPNMPTEKEMCSDGRKVGDVSSSHALAGGAFASKRMARTLNRLLSTSVLPKTGVKSYLGWKFGWKSRLLDVGLEAYTYPPEEAEDAAHPPIQITLRLSDDVMYFKDPVIARWDPAGQQWRTDGISNITYKTQEKSITFEMDAFYTIALLQDVHCNMLYQAWELRPTGMDEALLIVTTVFATIQIQIKGNQCMLSSVVVKEKDVLSHMTGKWISPLDLRAVLKKAGVNIFPGEHSHKYVSVNKKAPLAEDRAYQQMALVASAFAFAWSKWNLEAGQEKVVFKVSEHLKADSIEDKDWSLYMFNGQKAQKLKITETSEAFSEELEDDSEFHSTLYHMLKDFASKEAMDRVEAASCLFIDVVYQLLLATRVLTYS